MLRAFGPVLRRLHFCFSEILIFPSKYADWRLVALNGTANILNNHGVIAIFWGIFGPDPLPTREKCRNMPKIC